MNGFFRISPILLLFASASAHAQLSATVSPPKIVGNKVLVMMSMTNNLTEPITSAKAACFLVDASGEKLGIANKWVIGGSKDSAALAPKAGTEFNFVLTVKDSVSTNLVAHVGFTRVVTASGKVVDIKKDVVVK